ncbi:MAG: hypothetical protein R2874_02155 [Desulfobacterales bacterium]
MTLTSGEGRFFAMTVPYQSFGITALFANFGAKRQENETQIKGYSVYQQPVSVFRNQVA